MWPRWVTDLDKAILFPQNRNRLSWDRLALPLRKQMHWVLSGLNLILCEAPKSSHIWRSFLSADGLGANRVIYHQHRLKHQQRYYTSDTQLQTGLVQVRDHQYSYRANSVGERIPPWRTPCDTKNCSERWPFQFTHSRWDRYQLRINRITTLGNPRASSFSKRMVWSTVPKALEALIRQP